jgi:hypothetical protein
LEPGIEVTLEDTGDSDCASAPSARNEATATSGRAAACCGTTEGPMSPESNTNTTLRGELHDFVAGRREGRASSGEADERESTDVFRASRVAADAVAVTIVAADAVAVTMTESVSATKCDEAEAPKFCLDVGLRDTSLLLERKEGGRWNQLAH